MKGSHLEEVKSMVAVRRLLRISQVRGDRRTQRGSEEGAGEGGGEGGVKNK